MSSEAPRSSTRGWADLVPRAPTYAERARQLERQGSPDVLLDPGDAPQGFWNLLLMAVEWGIGSVASLNGSATGRAWAVELQVHESWETPPAYPGRTFSSIVQDGSFRFSSSSSLQKVRPALRLAAVELLSDLERPDADFAVRVNEAAQRHALGIRFESGRFVPYSSEHLHNEVTREALLLLGDTRLQAADALYRKAYSRLLTNDHAGAITAATSALEEMLRIGGASGAALAPLAASARSAGWVGAGVQQQIVKVQAFRQDADAHRVGTEDRELAVLVLNLTGSILVYLAKTMPTTSTLA